MTRSGGVAAVAFVLALSVPVATVFCPGEVLAQAADPSAVNAYARGMEAYAAGRWAEAAALFEEAYRLTRDHALLWNLGRALEKSGELEGARARYKEFLSHEEVHGDLRLKANDALLRVEVALREAALGGHGAVPDGGSEGSSATSTSAEPSGPVELEVALTGGYRSGLDDAEAIQSATTFDARLGWQEWSGDWVQLWLEGALGVASLTWLTDSALTPSTLCEADPAQCASGKVDKTNVWLAIVQSVRVPFAAGDDAFAVDGGLGAYFAGADENGIVVQARLQLLYGNVAMLYSLGRESGHALGVSAGLRYRF